MSITHFSKFFGFMILFILHVWMISNWHAGFESNQFAFLTAGNSALEFDYFYTWGQIIGSRLSSLAILLIDLIGVIKLIGWANEILIAK